MPSFTMLGRIGLERRTGEQVDAVLRQPKRLALLAYLALPRPGSWHRRDSLLSVFWPDADAARGRTALRNALYVLRQHLEEGTLRTRGDEEVSLDPDRFTTDVALLEAELEAGNPGAALASYTGELLPALFVPGAEPFEKWLDTERKRVLVLAVRAAQALADEREAAGDLTGAASAAARAAELSPDDEPALRRFMTLLDRAGASTRALAVYEEFRARVDAEYGAEPSASTSDLARQIKARAQSVATAPARRAGPPASPIHSAPVLPATAPAPSPPPVANAPAPVSGPVPWRGRRARAAVLLLAIPVVLLGALLRLRPVAANAATRTLLVLPMENATGDSGLAYLATGIAEDVATRLRSIAGLAQIRSAARDQWPRATRSDLPSLGREFGAALALRMRLTSLGDSLGVSGEVVDLGSGAARPVGTLHFAVDSVRDLESRLAAAVVGTAYRRPLPEEPRAPIRPVDPESYLLTLKGWHALLTVRDNAAAARLFSEATRLDPGNARAWAGTSSTRAADAVTWRVPFDEGMAVAEAAASRALALDSLQGTALANLGVLRGLRDRNLAEAESLFARATAAEPANPEIYLIEAALYRHAWQWEKARDVIRIARRLDPLNALYAEREAVLSLCAGRPDAALTVYQAAQRLDPAAAGVRDGIARALAGQGRWNEALAALGSPDSSGESGYWAWRAAHARPRLAALLAAERTGWISRAKLGTVYIAAGDLDRGLDLLEAEARAGDVGIYRLPCQPDVDRARDLPRFKALLENARRTLPR